MTDSNSKGNERVADDRFGHSESNGSQLVRYFSMPADFRKSTIDQYAELNRQYSFGKIGDTYGQLTVDNKFGSGRYPRQLPSVGFAELAEYVSYSAAKGIKFNYTLNASHMANRDCMREGVREIKEFLRRLHDAGIRCLTVAMPTVLEIVQSTGLPFQIRLSTIAQVLNANQALAYRNLGLDYIVVSEQITRDFRELAEIRSAFGEKVELIVNSICHINCINRKYHYDHMSSSQQSSVTSFFERRCVARKFSPLSNHLRVSWIRPEDLGCYTDIGIHYFKLQGRQAVMTGDPVRAVKAYLDGQFEGNLSELLEMFVPDAESPVRIYMDNRKLDSFLRPFVEKPGFCRNHCEKCHYCDEVAKKAIDMDRSRTALRTWEYLKSDRGDAYKLLLKTEEPCSR